MRCKNCGWANPQENTKCAKCSALLGDSIDEAKNQPSPERISSDQFVPKQTTKCCPECGYPTGRVDKKCPHCGYEMNIHPPILVAEEKEEVLPVEDPPSVQVETPDIPDPPQKICTYCKSPVSDTAVFCINCGVSLTNEKKSMMHTMMPWSSAAQTQVPKCALTLITREGDQSNDATLRFAGDVIQLNRGNTEPGNQTITSKIQAELSFENDQWYLQDKSTLKTTYIYAGEKTALKPGDVIVLGNRMFEFNCSTDK